MGWPQVVIIVFLALKLVVGVAQSTRSAGDNIGRFIGFVIVDLVISAAWVSVLAAGGFWS